MQRVVTALIAIVVLSVSVSGRQSDAIDDFVRREIRAQRIPGATVVVSRDGTVIKAAGYGFADLKQQTPAAPDTVYHIGSAGKTIMASAAMLLVADGKVRLDDPVSRYLTDAPASWRGITIRHLLSHTSGLVREVPGFDRVTTQMDARVMRTAYSVPLSFPPGERWAYSNLGYTALAEIISITSGQPWSDFVTARIFRPLGMTSTRLTTHDAVPKRAVGYTDNDAQREARFEGNPHPAGGFLSTALDLAKWDAALRAGSLLSPDILRQMWAPIALNNGTTHSYGLGWELEGVGRVPYRVHHGGAINGYLSEIVHLVDEPLSVIVLINMDDANLGSLVQGVVERARALPAGAVAPR